MTPDYRGRRALVLGLGSTGLSTARYLSRHGALVRVADTRAEPPQQDALARALPDVPIERGPFTSATFDGAELIAISPGIAKHEPVIEEAVAAGAELVGDVELFARALPPQQKVLAITGTNGKTTVTTLVDRILRAAGIASAAAGNIGRPLLDAAGDDVDVIVAEVSSFQLTFISDAFAPDVAVLLNVAEDHVDWHGSVHAYAQAKAELFRHQGASGLLVVNRDDPVALGLARDAPGRITRFGLGVPAPDDFGVRGADLVGPPGVLGAVPASGAPHDIANALAAAAAALAVGADVDAVARTLDGFTGLAHRVQLVGEHDGVRWYDDSKATNPHATASALAGFEHAVLIAGGRNKGLDLGGLRIHAAQLRAVVAIGEAASEVEAAFADAVPVTRAGSMRDAVRAAAAHALPGDAVVLSPACASFDWYESYAARGDDFAREVRALEVDSARCPDGEGRGA